MSARVPKEVQAVGGQRNPHMKHNVKVGDSSHCMIDRRILWVQLGPSLVGFLPDRRSSSLFRIRRDARLCGAL